MSFAESHLHTQDLNNNKKQKRKEK